MSNDQQGPFRQDGRPVPPPAPEGGWGGEYDGDSTAFIQLPENLPGPYQYGSADGAGGMPDPLAAPGTGHGWEPPAIDPGAHPAPGTQAPVTPEATTDPAAPVQWTMPFAGGQAEPASASTEPQRPGQEQAPPPGAAAAMGQGAAAALAGSHEARVRQQRRPQGDGGQEAQEPAGGSGGDWSAVPAPGATGQWSIPFAAAGSPDDSGEYLAAAAAGRAPEPPPARGPREAHGPEEHDRETEAAGPAEPGTETAPDADAGDAPEEPGAPDAGETGGTPEPPPAGEAPADPSADPSAPRAAEVDSEHPHVSYVLRVNGAERPVTDAWIGESLLYVLRERLGLAGAKDGCSQGECGACSVQVDGRLVASCLVPAATTAGSEIRTVEGLAQGGMPCDVQRALAACGAVQCGFCVPGMAMTLHDLLEGNHDPTELETRQAVSGNLCRCSGYRGVLDAVRTVVAEREAAAATLAEAREAEARDAEAGGRRTGDGGERGDGSRIHIPHQAGPASGRTHHEPPQDGGAQ
ncbi:2Fe-2S iron-sulfur cluster-binding protein [Streptomyces radiopugnans]|uniref:Aerobic-type carbon monoxide dehydrogenase, small subunit, CoxS/CutS family n=1 Tax=Streptomyces radiopugnans TaxID=403935 RepID=A0A1H8YUD1_9ACTN|nr:2Fe-2S iron-sulfur cluster-binding protein [Streptomyces radiopugnans]SEP55746.1 Aerobic-type carbon monoxide dehydrogenase, small subunit, CoxS/CutS family [Streptomyces radiopugnans]